MNGEHTVTNGTTDTTTVDKTDKGGGGTCGDDKCKPDVSNANDYNWYTTQEPIPPNHPTTFGEQFIAEYEEAKDMNCDQLESEFDWAYAIFESHSFVSPGTFYYNLHPFDDDIWGKEVPGCESGVCKDPGCVSSYRYSAGVLQILDCLLKKKGCRQYPT